mmetsp:Transcript_17549/g.35415  ORF Transcript_17549/g.35415 Transcript_17549/m.35415 type:complete len:509 (+) Transcript_17549:98-1624(+)|eukprot:CAMPEP_0167820704 /NCGR_PEP_ID=MMETSP0112_2-20121227/6263_1 /TAXON_ID=91324 /ORGANISM="Lotharella globosa, Strain CCCM811" /LENGTH=508 /DNA_ID=CAMNT_0007721339 /DNA_START=85 /DNA_END=1611 /DNA_ORIENTATION=-
MVQCFYASTNADGATGFKYMCVNASNVTDAAGISLATTSVTDSLSSVTDRIWILICGIFVFWMQAGFAMLEAGTVRPKHTNNILFKNLIDATLGAMCFWLLGYSFAFGRNRTVSEDHGSDNEFIGSGNFALQNYNEDTQYHLWFFQWAFASAASTIVSGSIAERCKLEAYFMYTILLTTFVYPVVVHWVWSPTGWLSPTYTDENGERFLKQNGFIDFAGSGVVHITGGFAGLVGAITIGPRKGFFGHGQNVKAQFKGSNELLCSLGVSILWMGWYGFNCGSTLGASGIAGNGTQMDLASKVAVCTTISGAASTLATSLFSRLYLGHYDLSFCLNGVLSGLVSITAGCAVVEPWGALMIGLIGSAFYIAAHYTLDLCKIDDPLDAFSVHGASGVWGCLAVGIFATRSNIKRAYGFDNDAMITGNQLRNQFIGVLAITSWVIFMATMIFVPLSFFGMLRVSQKAEKMGLDVAEHGVPWRHGQQVVDVQMSEKKSQRPQSNYAVSSAGVAH